MKPYHERVIDMKFLRIITALILSSAMLFGCATKSDTPAKNEGDVTSPSDSSGEDYGVIWWKNPDETTAAVTVETMPIEENRQPEPDSSVLTISGWNYKSELDDGALSRAAELSGLGVRFVQYYPEDVTVKLLAGDTDVDIYIMLPSTLNRIKEKSLYLPIESDIIDGFNSECFDYISELCKDTDGNTVAMPIGNEISFIAYPSQAAEEVGFDRDDIAYMDVFQKLITEYDGDRKSYSYGSGFIYNYINQYNGFYCDFKNKEAGYDTELFKKIYSLFDGWSLQNVFPAPIGFTNPSSIDSSNRSRIMTESAGTLFIAAMKYGDYIQITEPDLFAQDSPEFSIYDWRATHIPWISHDVENNVCEPIFAVINPYSNHFDEAVKALEYVAENYYDSIDQSLNGYPFLFKDRLDYPNKYLTDTNFFEDVFDIAENGCLVLDSAPHSGKDVAEYQAGRVSLDEAIKMYTREIDAYLNE